MGEVIGGGENELFQRGSVYDSSSFKFSTFRRDGVNPSKRLGNANLEVVRDVYNSIHYAALTLQRDHVHVIGI